MIIPATTPPSASLDPVSLPSDTHTFPAESQLRLDPAQPPSSAASVLDSNPGGPSDPSAPRAPPGADQSIQYMITTMKGLLARAQVSTADMEALEGLNTMNRKLNVLMGTLNAAAGKNPAFPGVEEEGLLDGVVDVDPAQPGNQAGVTAG